MRSNALDFYFDEGLAGRFKGPEPPCSPGQYRYVAYRSHYHYKFWQALQRGEAPRCSYVSDGSRMFFSVSGTPKDDLLYLNDFSGRP